MKTIESLEKKLAALRALLKVCTDPDDKANLEEQIDFMQDDIDELEDANREQDEWEELTGTRPQDLYDERNGYAIRQSEAIERFRKEY